MDSKVSKVEGSFPHALLNRSSQVNPTPRPIHAFPLIPDARPPARRCGGSRPALKCRCLLHPCLESSVVDLGLQTPWHPNKQYTHVLQIDQKAYSKYMLKNVERDVILFYRFGNEVPPRGVV